MTHIALRFPKTISAFLLTLVAITAFGTSRELEKPVLQTVIEPAKSSFLKNKKYENTPFVQSIQTARGETLSSLLYQLGSNDAAFRKFVTTNGKARKILHLKEGSTITATVDDSGKILSMHFAAPSSRRKKFSTTTPSGGITKITRVGSAMKVFYKPVASNRILATAAFTIKTSLFSATDEAGVPEAIAIQIADILENKKDLAPGDKVSIVFEQFSFPESLDSMQTGQVMGLSVIGKKNHYKVFWFNRGKENGEYFSSDGKNLTKNFLKFPVEYSRISSGFTASRRHPIFGFNSAHKGVDFSAPIGTKVRSTSDGIVQSISYKKGYGNVISIKHNLGISTRYAHLSSFAPRLSIGEKVSKGQVLGYVGKTGWATGPHLHYEVIAQNKHINPMNFKAAHSSKPLSSAEIAYFKKTTSVLETSLSDAPTIQLASNFE